MKEFTLEMLEYYTNLLIIQYRDKPKARGTISALVKSFIADNLSIDIRDAFNIDTAVGVQLDMLGMYIGVDRFYKESPFYGNYFSLYDYISVTIEDDNKGFTNYTDFETDEGKFLSYNDVSNITNALTDDQYRILLKLKIAQNNSNHSYESISEILYTLFGDDVFCSDNYNMTMTYFASNTDWINFLIIAYNKGVLLKPAGVQITAIILDSEYFAFSDYFDRVYDNDKGFTNYTDFDIETGTIISYNNSYI